MKKLAATLSGLSLAAFFAVGSLSLAVATEDHNSSRSNRSNEVESGDGTPEGEKAQAVNVNSSRSNTSSEVESGDEASEGEDVQAQDLNSSRSNVSNEAYTEEEPKKSKDKKDGGG